MVAPSSRPRSAVNKDQHGDSSVSSSSYNYALLAVKVCLVLIILFWLPRLVTGGGAAEHESPEQRVRLLGRRRRRRMVDPPSLEDGEAVWTRQAAGLAVHGLPANERSC